MKTEMPRKRASGCFVEAVVSHVLPLHFQQVGLILKVRYKPLSASGDTEYQLPQRNAPQAGFPVQKEGTDDDSNKPLSRSSAFIFMRTDGRFGPVAGCAAEKGMKFDHRHAIRPRMWPASVMKHAEKIEPERKGSHGS